MSEICSCLLIATSCLHGGHGGTRPPRILEWVTLMQIVPPDLVILQNFAHEKMGQKIFLAPSSREIVPRTNTVGIVWCLVWFNFTFRLKRTYVGHSAKLVCITMSYFRTSTSHSLRPVVKFSSLFSVFSAVAVISSKEWGQRHGERVAQAYNGDLGDSPQWGQGAEPLVRGPGQGAKPPPPLKLKGN